MNAKTRTKRQILKARATSTRAARRIHRRGNASLTTHALRKTATKLGITGTQHRVHAGRRMRTTTRFTTAQVAALAGAYRPRKPAYKLAAAKLALAA
jgi:homoserine kinase